MVQPIHIAVLMVAACLAGCSSYSLFDPDTTASFGSTAKQAEGLKTAEQTSAQPAVGSDKTEAAALNSLFARAAAGKLNADATGSAEPTPAVKPIAVATTA